MLHELLGNYVGLHPMTVIVSIFVWGLIIGGVIGLPACRNRLRPP